MDISGIFAGTFEALKRRFGLFVLVTLFPAALGVVLILIGVAILATSAVAAGSGYRSGLPAGLILGMVVYFVGVLAAALGQLKSYGMMSVAAYEIAQGQHPDFRGLLARTRGFLPRMVPLMAIGLGIGLVVGLLFGGVMVGAMSSLSNTGTRGGSAAIAGLLGFFFLFVIVLIPITYFLQVKLLYTVPATAIEQVSGVDGVKRSWRLTRGAFWRTLGYYLVAYFGISVVSSLISGVAQAALMPTFAIVDTTTGSADPSAIFAGLGAMIPGLVILFVLMLAFTVVTVPFLQTYTTYMFVDQVRRSELPTTVNGYATTAPGYGYQPWPQAQPGPYGGPAPQGYGQPGPSYGQPPQGYAQPFPGYSQPGQGYPQPPQYPPQQPQPPQGQWPSNAQQPPEQR